MNAHYGYFDIDNTINSIRSKQKRIWNTEPKICKDADVLFIDIETLRKDGLSKRSIKEVKPSLDNCRDIFKEIDSVKNEIEKYKNIGIEERTLNNGRKITMNWNKVAIRTERQLQKLYDLL